MSSGAVAGIVVAVVVAVAAALAIAAAFVLLRRQRRQYDGDSCLLAVDGSKGDPDVKQGLEKAGHMPAANELFMNRCLQAV